MWYVLYVSREGGPIENFGEYKRIFPQRKRCAIENSHFFIGRCGQSNKNGLKFVDQNIAVRTWENMST
jgi:hypothetical protein